MLDVLEMHEMYRMPIYDQHLIWLMKKLYNKATGVLRIAGEHIDQLKKGSDKGASGHRCCSTRVEK